MQYFIESSPFTSSSEQATKSWHCYKSSDKIQFENDLARINWEQALH